jgi:hypothetical protein
MAALTALFGAVVTFTSAYLIDKTKGTVWFRRTAYFLSILPLASVAVINMDDAGDTAPQRPCAC